LDFSISLLKDASEALDKAVEAIGKLGSLFVTGAKNGVALFDYATARQVAVLSSFSTQVAGLQQSQGIILRPTLQDYIDNPSSATWRRVIEEVKITRDYVSEIAETLKKASPAIATQPFFGALVGAFMARDRALGKVLKSPESRTADEVHAFKLFLASYDMLIAELVTTGETLRQYIEALRAKQTWPKGLA